MNKTSIGALFGVFLFIAAAVGILTWRFYGSYPPIPASGAITVWLLWAVCILMVVRLRRALSDEHGIGLDRTQLNPLAISRMLVVGKSAAWTGAIIGGGYAGVAAYVFVHLRDLLAAQAEAPIVVMATLGSVFLSVTGVVLERHCQAPPPPDGAHG